MTIEKQYIKAHLKLLNGEFTDYIPEHTGEAKVDQKLIRNQFSELARECTVV